MTANAAEYIKTPADSTASEDLRAARETLRRMQSKGRPFADAMAAKFRESIRGAASANEAPMVDPEAPATPETIGATLAAEWAAGRTLDGARAANWYGIGCLLLDGRALFNGNDKAFGQWIAQHCPGMDRTTRADAMWLIESPELAALLSDGSTVIPDELVHPTSIRRWFRRVTKTLTTANASPDSKGPDDRETSAAPAQVTVRLIEGMSMAEAAAVVSAAFNATGTTRTQATDFCSRLLALITAGTAVAKT